MVESGVAPVGAIEQNLVDLFGAYGAADGVELHETPDALCAITGVAHAAGNAVLRTRMSGDVDAAIDRALAPYRARRLPMLWWTGPATKPANLGQYLARHGLVPAIQLAGMSMDVDAADTAEAMAAPSPGDIAVERVRDVGTLADWLVPAAAAFNWNAVASRGFHDLFARVGLEDGAPLRHYLARRAGLPVAVASLLCDKPAGVAGIYNVATLPSERGRGLATALTGAVLGEAREAHQRQVVLHATPAAKGLYRRLGFEEHCALTVYAWLGGGA